MPFVASCYGCGYIVVGRTRFLLELSMSDHNITSHPEETASDYSFWTIIVITGREYSSLIKHFGKSTFWNIVRKRKSLTSMYPIKPQDKTLASVINALKKLENAEEKGKRGFPPSKASSEENRMKRHMKKRELLEEIGKTIIFCKVFETINLHDYEVSWEELKDVNEARGQEGAALKEYCDKYKEPPPLNLEIKREYYAIVGLWIVGKSRIGYEADDFEICHLLETLHGKRGMRLRNSYWLML